MPTHVFGPSVRERITRIVRFSLLYWNLWYWNAPQTSLNARGYIRSKRQHVGAQPAYDVGIQLSRLRDGTIQQNLDVEAVSQLCYL